MVGWEFIASVGQAVVSVQSLAFFWTDQTVPLAGLRVAPKEVDPVLQRIDPPPPPQQSRTSGQGWLAATPPPTGRG